MEDLKVPLFANYKERIIVFFILLSIFILNLSYEFYKYQKLTSNRFYETKAEVLNQYRKNGHFVLKLKSSDGFIFYTTSKEDLKDLTGRFVDILLIKTKFNITFLNYLKNFYTVSYIKRVLPDISLKEKISKFISSQHKSKNSDALYNALFIAKPISYELREKLSFLGISHLIAISGFHIGLIAAFLFFLFYLFYKPLQQKFFPYRNRVVDGMIFVSIMSFLYVYFLGEVASVLRAYIMMITAFFLYYRHIKILSFETLFWVVLLILANFVKLLFSIGFWLSVAGVFYIYLFLHYFSHLKKWQIFILLNIWVYFAMIPITHIFFENFSYMQFLSPLLSMFFVIFYPLSLLMHILGFGAVFDETIDKLLLIEYEKLYFKTPVWFLIIYLLISLFSIYKKRILYLLVLSSFTFLVYNIAYF